MNEYTRVEFTNESNSHAEPASDNEASFLERAGMELESRITPLVVIAIIAVLIALLVPA